MEQGPRIRSTMPWLGLNRWATVAVIALIAIGLYVARAAVIEQLILIAKPDHLTWQGMTVRTARPYVLDPKGERLLILRERGKEEARGVPQSTMMFSRAGKERSATFARWAAECSARREDCSYDKELLGSTALDCIVIKSEVIGHERGVGARCRSPTSDIEAMALRDTDLWSDALEKAPLDELVTTATQRFKVL